MEDVIAKLAADLPSTAVLLLLIVLWDRQVNRLLVMAEGLLARVTVVLEECIKERQER